MRTKNIVYDKLVGSRIRYYRVLKGLSQEKLGEMLEVTFQQVQKYEAGTNTLSAPKARQLMEIFHCALEDLLPAISTTEIGQKLGPDSVRLLQRVMQLDKPTQIVVTKLITALSEYRNAILHAEAAHV